MKGPECRAAEPRLEKTRRRAGPLLPAPRYLVLLFLAALLGGCDYFFASPFPDHVSRMVAHADLGSVFPREPHGYYRLEVRNRRDGAEFIVALSEGATYGFRVAIFDSQLKHLRTEVLPPYQDLFYVGSQLLFDDEGHLYVGRLVFDSSFGFDRLDDAAWNRYYGSGFYDSAEPPRYVFPWVPSANEIRWWIEPPEGGQTEHGSLQINGGTVSYGGLQQGAFHDMEDEFRTVALYARSDDGTIAGVRGPDTDFFGSLVSPILSDLNDSFSILSARYVDELWYTRRGTVVFSRYYDNDIAEMAVYDFSWPEARLIRTYRPNTRGDIQYAYSVDGRHFYVLSPRLNTLVKARTWW